MDAKLLLVKTITLLYLNGKLEDKSKDAIIIAKEVINLVKPKDKSLVADFGGTDPTTELRETLIYMANQPMGTEFDENELKQRFKVNVSENEGLYDALISGFINPDESQDKIIKMFNQQRSTIRAITNKNKIADVLKSFYVKANFQQDVLDYRNLLVEIQEELSPYITDAHDTTSIFDHPSIVNNVAIDSVESVGGVLTSAKDELDSTGVIRTPYKGLNRMMGKHHGIRRGELCVITALTHNYKSGLCLDIFMGCPLFNTPYMRDPNKKPLNLRLSFENTTQQDFNHIYTKLKETDSQLPVDMRNIDIGDATEFIMNKLNVNGYESKILHIEPSDFTYFDLFKLIEAYEESGYEIHLLTIDYLNMMSKAGCVNDTAGDNVRDLFRRARNFFLRRGIALVTPHQFSTEARKVERSEPRNFVKAVTGKGFYDSCSRLEQEIDLELSLHIVSFNGEEYLTMQRGKHRGVVTPAKDQYCVYKFEEVGGLPMDADGEDQSRKVIGAETVSEGGASPWFDGII